MGCRRAGFAAGYLKHLNQKLQQEGGTSDLSVEFKLLGQRVWIKYCERHFLELQTMVKESEVDSFVGDVVDD